MELKTKDSVLDKFQNRLGLDGSPAFAHIRREDYKTDDDFILALTEWESRRDDPRFREIERKYRREVFEQREAERAAQEAERRKEIRSNMTLTVDEQMDADNRATAAASDDLQRGRIRPAEFEERKAFHKQRFEDQRKDEKTAGQIFNEFARAEIARNRVSADANERRGEKTTGNL